MGGGGLIVKTQLQQIKPADIETRSFEIIAQELAAMGQALPPDQAPVIMRAIHASADFDYADNLYFSPGALEAGLQALKEGACIVTDTNMAFSGVSKPALAKLQGRALCFMAEEDVAEQARRRGVTRAAVCMEKAAALEGPLIVAVGNAPTALIRLCELMEEGRVAPRLVIGAPVGFVNVVESKEMLMRSKAPCIVARGRKGGSNIAAALCNALLYLAAGRGEQATK